METVKSNNNSPINWQFPLILVAVYAVLDLILFVGGPSLMANNWTGVVKFLIVLVAYIFVARAIRKEAGYISFGKLFISLLICVVIYAIASGIIDYIIFYVIDDSYMTAVKELVMEKMYDNPWMQGMSDEQMDKVLEDTAERFDQGKTLAGQGLGFLFTAVGWTIVSLILAAIFKKKSPEFGE